mgnify:CR=1 FL=1
MIGANKKKSDFATPYTVSNALTKGGAAVKLSALIMGLGTSPTSRLSKV